MLAPALRAGQIHKVELATQQAASQTLLHHDLQNGVTATAMLVHFRVAHSSVLVTLLHLQPTRVLQPSALFILATPPHASTVQLFHSWCSLCQTALLLPACTINYCFIVIIVINTIIAIIILTNITISVILVTGFIFVVIVGTIVNTMVIGISIIIIIIVIVIIQQ